MSEYDATFYAVCNADYYPGAVALLNSLRLTGHSEELVIGDCGLTPAQRNQLRTHCTLFEVPANIATDPVLLKAFPYLLKPTGAVVIIDSDMIVTESHEATLKLASEGKICAFADPEHDRCFREWRQLFNLAGDPRHQTYVTTSYVVFSTVHWPDLLGRWWRACEQIPSHRTFSGGALRTDPFAQGDQDALNAVLMSEISEEALALLPDEQRPTFKGSRVKVRDLRTLSCTYNGVSTRLLHADGTRKPWLVRSWFQVRNHAYVRLLRRLILGADVALRVPAEDLPIWLRSGIFPGLLLRALHVFTVTFADPLLRNDRTRGLVKRAIQGPILQVRRLQGLLRA